MTRPGEVALDEVGWSPGERADAPRFLEGEGESIDIRSGGYMARMSFRWFGSDERAVMGLCRD
jgi:hypothetical protein